jgi:hypothetical protein
MTNIHIPLKNSWIKRGGIEEKFLYLHSQKRACLCPGASFAVHGTLSQMNNLI